MFILFHNASLIRTLYYYELAQNAARKTILNQWQNYDASVIVLILRKQCHSDERYIRSIIQEDDKTEIQGSFNRPFTVLAKDIKAVMNLLPLPASNDTVTKLLSMFQMRFTILKVVEHFVLR